MCWRLPIPAPESHASVHIDAPAVEHGPAAGLPGHRPCHGASRHRRHADRGAGYPAACRGGTAAARIGQGPPGGAGAGRAPARPARRNRHPGQCQIAHHAGRGLARPADHAARKPGAPLAIRCAPLRAMGNPGTARLCALCRQRDAAGAAPRRLVGHARRRPARRFAAGAVRAGRRHAGADRGHRDGPGGGAVAPVRPDAARQRTEGADPVRAQ